MPRKKEEPKKQVNARLRISVFEKVERYAKESGVTTTTMAADLVAEAIRNREESQEETMLRLLTHFDNRMAARLSTLNDNLREATGMILTPRPPSQVKPDLNRVINSEADARKWVKALMEDIPE